MSKGIDEMTEGVLREELQRIRNDRRGVGRKRVKAAKTKRIEGVKKERRQKGEATKEKDAEWV